jgi:hypothetical protein
VIVKPDGFVRIHEREIEEGVPEHAFFLETGSNFFVAGRKRCP